MDELAGCTAVVTGAASGLGRAMAERFAAEGMQLVTMGDLIPGDVCVYPEKRTYKPARGLELPY